ncbi:hypothetical protein CP556_06365 [Natrinema sp. CBA1119]|uniref:hypothetical protein n=1 Tax=Natrinema sp. CBA1119 TaxID=1608465 RepID=UPI000BF75F35|nr:hypothetical protein [Natrinema sp. CBA1119]PGF15775.1 hypothetical protein CP556_06365 [Natrinema sp. CBA1119]
MRSLSEILFDLGYFPLRHESVKQDFIGWYYEGTKNEFVRERLDVENSRLSKLAQDAGTEAKEFDQTNNISQMVTIFEEKKSQIETIFYYLAFFVSVTGGGFTAVGVLQIKNIIFSTIVQTIGAILLIGPIGLIIIYRILIHQIKTSSDLVTRFNKELVENPGDIRENDQDWHWIASQFLWNRSLLSPSTHACLILLSIIRVISKRLYGIIAADLRDEINEFVEMDSREIISHQIRRALDGDLLTGQKSRPP